MHKETAIIFHIAAALFFICSLGQNTPFERGEYFFYQKKRIFFIKTEKIVAGREEYFLAEREKYFSPSLGKEKSAFFRRIAKGYGVAPYTAGETLATKTACRKKCGGFVNFL